MKSEARIRKGRLADVSAIYRLGKKIHELDFSRTYPFHERAELKEFVTRTRENIVLVAEQNGTLVGFIYARILCHSAGGWCMLDNIAVEKSRRRKGIGTAMLKELYGELKKRKIFYVQILEEAHHEKTKAFWKSKGFKKTRTFLWAEKEIG